MPRNKKDDIEFSFLARKYGLEASEVRRIVFSFFDILQLKASKLPLDNPTRIFSKDKFNDFVYVYHIPYIGRIGPVYSRYLLWRKNESVLIEQKNKVSFHNETERQKAERIACEIIYGKRKCCKDDRKKKYKRVWMVGKDGKRLAKQIIPINEE